jgi:hypothetical protein
VSLQFLCSKQRTAISTVMQMPYALYDPGYDSRRFTTQI